MSEWFPMSWEHRRSAGVPTSRPLACAGQDVAGDGTTEREAADEDGPVARNRNPPRDEAARSLYRASGRWRQSIASPTAWIGLPIGLPITGTTWTASPVTRNGNATTPQPAS